MAGAQNNMVLDLATEFNNATLELGDASEPIVHHHEGDVVEEEGESQWDICLIGKIIIEGKMGHKAVEKHIKFTWWFIPPEGL